MEVEHANLTVIFAHDHPYLVNGKL